MNIKKALIIIAFIPFVLYAIGTGGLLIHVPYAKIYFDGVEQKDFKAYVHPIEGAWLILMPNKDYGIAFDKVKKQIIKIDMQYIQKTEWDNIVNVPHSAPFTVVPGRPSFNKTYSEGMFDKINIKIFVER